MTKAATSLRRRRQAQQIEIGAADERAPIGLRRRRQLLARHLRQQKRVDRIGLPRGRVDARYQGPDRPLELPLPPILVRDRPLLGFQLRVGAGGVVRDGFFDTFERGAVLDPFADELDVRIRQLRLLAGHRRFFFVRDKLVESALVRLVRHDDVAALAALQQGGVRAQVELALGVRAVALEADVLEDLVDLSRPFLFVLRRDGSGGCEGDESKSKDGYNATRRTPVHAPMVAENAGRVNAAFLMRP